MVDTEVKGQEFIEEEADTRVEFIDFTGGSEADTATEEFYNQANSQESFLPGPSSNRTEDSQVREANHQLDRNWEQEVQEDSQVARNATEIPIKDFREFLGISTVAAGALLLFFIGLFLQGAIQAPVVIVLGTILLVATVGFARTWVALRP